MAKFLILIDKPAIGDKTAELKDGNGRYVWHLLFKANAPMKDLAVEFLQDENGHSRWRSIEAKHKPTVVLTMGQEATDQFDIDGKVFKTRGSVYEKSRPNRKMYVVPTFHPQDLKKPYNMFAEESLERGFYTAGDIRKAVRVYNEGWPKQVEKFNINPTLEDVQQFVAKALKEKLLLGCDLEATGLSIEHSQIVVHGFAWSETEAIVIPETKLHGDRYWSPKEWPEVVKLLNQIYSKGRMMWQNGVGYDLPLLRARGWDVNLEAYTDETMILHHTLNPELPHNIGFISSIYGRQPYWKDSFLTRKETIHETNQAEMKTYNARDCIALHQINNAMVHHMDELVESDPLWKELPNVYQKGMQAARVVIDMQRAGLQLDDKKVTDWHKYVQERLDKADGELQKLYTLPKLFNLSSGDHLRWLLYGEKPKAWGKKYEDERELYDTPAYNLQYTCKVCNNKITKKTYDVSGSREFNSTERVLKCSSCKTTRMCRRTEKEPTSVKGKSKTSKKYLELLNIEKLVQTVPLYKLKSYVPKKTKKGNDSATDKNALVRYLIAINNRLSQLASMKRRREPHEIEEKGLKDTRDYIIALQEYIKIFTLRKSFWDFATWQDGKVRPSFLVTGTATGRFSCKNPNLQQVPSGGMGKRIRSCFRAPKGSQLLSVDFSNLEVQIGARVFGDDPLIKMLEAGINMH
ncbi:MAG: hypothetical protein DRI57_33160, partial [Deltaproteobacteria bacterium]